MKKNKLYPILNFLFNSLLISVLRWAIKATLCADPCLCCIVLMVVVAKILKVAIERLVYRP